MSLLAASLVTLKRSVALVADVATGAPWGLTGPGAALTVLWRHLSEDLYSLRSSMAQLHCARLAIARLIYQLVIRFPDSISGITSYVSDLAGLVERCRQQSETGNAKQVLLNTILSIEMSQLFKIVQTEQDRYHHPH
ncbi:MAG: hypothetical protein JOS17DRAFT_786926 [Linnemannia elongata]|nr:MAG: hypothetical protein JOS17DRAFT_786926 [Linnemannia elongata]